MSSITVFLTGAYGAVGAAVARACLQRGDRVVVLRRSPSPQSALVLDGIEPECTVVDGDLLTSALVHDALRAHAVDAVVHLAAHSIVETAHRTPVATFEANVRGTWIVLEACRMASVQAVVTASSIKAYGSSLDDRARREDDPLHGRGVYDVSKSAADLIARSYWDAYGVPVVAARLANVYGGGDLRRSRLVPGVIGALLAGERPVLRTNGSPHRDFLYVEDAAAAYLAIVDALREGRGCGEALNAGGSPHTVFEVCERLCHLMGTSNTPEIVEAVGDRPGAPVALDTSRLHELTGWAPRVTLQEGLARTLEWYQRFPYTLAVPAVTAP